MKRKRLFVILALCVLALALPGAAMTASLPPEVQAQIDELAAQVAALTAERDDAMAQIAELRAQVAALETQIAEAVCPVPPPVAELEAQIDALKAEMEALAAEREAALADAAALKEALIEAETAVKAGNEDVGPQGEMPDVAAAFFAETVYDLSGAAFDPSILLQRSTIVNVWASWCPPCREEIPALAQVSGEFAGRVNVVSILLDASEDGVTVDGAAVAEAQGILSQSGASYPCLIPNKALLDLIRRMNVEYIPTTWFLGATGRLMWEEVGSMDVQGWRDAAERLVSGD